MSIRADIIPTIKQLEKRISNRISRLENIILKDFRIIERELMKDIIKIIISFTPVSGFVDSLKFVHKWFIKRKHSADPIAGAGKHVEKHDRRQRKL
jgi:hypothetical protein